MIVAYDRGKPWDGSIWSLMTHVQNGPWGRHRSKFELSENDGGVAEPLHKKFIFADLAEKQLGPVKLSVFNSLVNGLALYLQSFFFF